ncbi:MAG: zinc ribbon domain-containing protein [Succinivibrio sp.]
MRERNLSRRCTRCGHIDQENSKTQTGFCCVKCGYSNNADIVGANNIKGQDMPGLGVSLVKKLEPL